MSSGGFAVKNGEGIREITLPAEGGRYEWNAGDAQFEFVEFVEPEHEKG